MRKLSLILLLMFNFVLSHAQDNPHGDDLKMNCSSCHSTESWEFISKDEFNHDDTDFPLKGQHAQAKCALCHTSLVFSDANSNCSSCHEDIHQNTVGADCDRCHNEKMWLLPNITEIHNASRFPLLGAHNTAECSSCHTSSANLRFEPISVDCYSCHKDDYASTTEPNHILSGFSTNCIECHRIEEFSWAGAGINHDFFPLSGGHAINECSVCHTEGIGQSISSDCYECHEWDYATATNPVHTSASFSTDCALCHSIAPGWSPANYWEHDNFFPIYSGDHDGEWNSCTDCHKNSNDFSSFTCTDCHAHSRTKMDSEHRGVGGYVYESFACFTCHPRGSSDGEQFNHNQTNFPLKGAHISADCNECHVNGSTNLSTDCESCHLPEYNNTVNPNHTALGLAQQCDECHTENPNWEPAKFPQHNRYYPLNGAHQNIANDCYLCHAGNYTSTANTCYECHKSDYENTSDPNHVSSNFSKDCQTCHSENAWEPSTFDHDNQYFPIYSGSHQGEWNSCTECHTQPNNYAEFSCIACHEHNQSKTANEHREVQGYSYNSASCFSCHPRGQSDEDD